MAGRRIQVPGPHMIGQCSHHSTLVPYPTQGSIVVVGIAFQQVQGCQTAVSNGPQHTIHIAVTTFHNICRASKTKRMINQSRPAMAHCGRTALGHAVDVGIHTICKIQVLFQVITRSLVSRYPQNRCPMRRIVSAATCGLFSNI